MNKKNNHKTVLTSILFLVAGMGSVSAQEAVDAGGGDAFGNGGSVSYSVGQVVYTTNSGTDGSVAQGVQQPYEISTANGVEESSINLEVSVYPNPTTNYLILKVEENVGLSYHLFDLQSKLITNDRISQNSTTINMEALPRSTYFLKVSRDNQVVKTFQIIKN